MEVKHWSHTDQAWVNKEIHLPRPNCISVFVVDVGRSCWERLNSALFWPWIWQMIILSSRTRYPNSIDQPLDFSIYPLRVTVTLESASLVFSPWKNKGIENPGLQGRSPFMNKQVCPIIGETHLTRTCLPNLKSLALACFLIACLYMVL